jgi:hypothetical protein
MSRLFRLSLSAALRRNGAMPAGPAARPATDRPRLTREEITALFADDLGALRIDLRRAA